MTRVAVHAGEVGEWRGGFWMFKAEVRFKNSVRLLEHIFGLGVTPGAAVHASEVVQGRGGSGVLQAKDFFIVCQDG
ncbi:hypothetical protein D3C81_2255700 [compost metagenome]